MKTLKTKLVTKSAPTFQPPSSPARLDGPSHNTFCGPGLNHTWSENGVGYCPPVVVFNPNNYYYCPHSINIRSSILTFNIIVSLLSSSVPTQIIRHLFFSIFFVRKKLHLPCLNNALKKTWIYEDFLNRKFENFKHLVQTI